MFINTTKIPEHLKANFHEWCLKPSWSIFEAACLSYEINPNKVEAVLNREIRSFRHYTLRLGYNVIGSGRPFEVSGFSDRLEVLLRQEWRDFYLLGQDKIRCELPSITFVKWFEGTRIEFPEKLKELVRQFTVDAESEIKQAESIAVVNNSKKDYSDDDINPKRKRELYKIILAFAVKHKFNPNNTKNHSTAAFKNAVETLGLNINDNTIRDIISDAHKMWQDDIDSESLFKTEI